MAFYSADQIEALAQNTVRVEFLVKMEFVSETVYLWNGHYDLLTGGNTYKPMHGIAVIDGLGTSSQSISEQITFTVSGIPDQDPDILSLALEATPEANQQFVTVYMQFFDNDWQPIGSPVLVWIGFLQPPRVTTTEMDGETGQTQTISLTAENAFFNRSKPPFGRNTDRDQQNRYPGDKFFQFVPSLLSKTFRYPDY